MMMRKEMFGQNLIRIREKRGFSRAQMARLTSMDPSNYARLETGGTHPTLHTLERLAEALEVPVSFLADPTLPSPNLPVVAFVSAGEGADFDDQGFPVGTGMDEVPRPPDLKDPHAFAVRVSGDSMVPKFEEGQVVVVDTTQPVYSGSYVVVGLVSGDRLVKRYREAGNSVILDSVNQDYPPKIIPRGDLAFVYKVVWSRES